MFHTFLRTNSNEGNQVHWSNCDPYWVYTYKLTWQSQSILDLGLSDHDLIYCTRKTSLPKSHKYNDSSFAQWKRYYPEKFLQILREIFFANYLTYTCVNDAYSDFSYRFVGAINFIAKMHLQKMILKKKKSYFENKLDKIRNKPKELWKVSKSLGLNSDKARKSKIYLK